MEASHRTLLLLHLSHAAARRFRIGAGGAWNDEGEGKAISDTLIGVKACQRARGVMD